MCQTTARSKPARSVRLFQDGGVWLMRITEGRQVDVYTVCRVASDYGLLFRVEKIGTTRNGQRAALETYHVGIDPEAAGWSCDCAGHCYTGRCKHASALVALLGSGKLAAMLNEPAGV